MCGTFSLTSLKVSMEKSFSLMPISFASAKRCRTLLEEAPMALSTATAFFSALGVSTSEGRMLFFTAFITASMLFFTAFITASPVSLASMMRRE